MLCKKVALKNFAEFTGKHLFQSLFLRKLQAEAYFIKKEMLWHRCFLVSFCESFKSMFFIEHLRWLRQSSSSSCIDSSKICYNDVIDVFAMLSSIAKGLGKIYLFKATIETPEPCVKSVQS